MATPHLTFRDKILAAYPGVRIKVRRECLGKVVTAYFLTIPSGCSLEAIGKINQWAKEAGIQPDRFVRPV